MQRKEEKNNPYGVSNKIINPSKTLNKSEREKKSTFSRGNAALQRAVFMFFRKWDSSYTERHVSEDLGTLTWTWMWTENSHV